MTVGEIKNEIMFQTNNDVDDLDEFLPYLMDYINQGYDQLVYAWAKEHLGTDDWPWLTADTDIPALPEWTHRGLVDYATWLVYRNGNPQKQERGLPFRSAFLELLSAITAAGGKNGRVTKFINIPE